jgi:hypothetical protein
MLRFGHRWWKYRKFVVHEGHGEIKIEMFFPSQSILGFMVTKGIVSDRDRVVLAKFLDQKFQ